MSSLEVREARKKKILENSKKRMEKLQALKSTDTELKNETLIHDSNAVNVDEKVDSESINDEFSERSEKDNCNVESENNAPDTYKDISQPNVNYEKTELLKNLEKENSAEEEDSHKHIPIYENKKYRALIFVLLAWSLYLVVEQGYDKYLLYLVNKPLKKEALGSLFVTAFCAVEFQLIFLAFLTNSNVDNQAMTFFLLNIIVGQSKMLNILKKIFICLGNIVTDLSIYIFSLVLFHFLNDIYGW